MSSDTTVKVYNCPKCDYTNEHTYNVTRHIVVKHNEGYESTLYMFKQAIKTNADNIANTLKGIKAERERAFQSFADSIVEFNDDSKFSINHITNEYLTAAFKYKDYADKFVTVLEKVFEESANCCVIKKTIKSNFCFKHNGKHVWYATTDEVAIRQLSIHVAKIIRDNQEEWEISDDLAEFCEAVLSDDWNNLELGRYKQQYKNVSKHIKVMIYNNYKRHQDDYRRLLK